MKRVCWLILLAALLPGCGRGCDSAKRVHGPGAGVVEAELPHLKSIPPEQPFSFAVLGDNRGESSGKQAPVFLDMMRAIGEAGPQLVVNTGDMINGYKDEDEAQLRKLWQGYKEAVAGLKAPLFHVVGNHDIFNPLSARLWKELWGPTYYSFDYGCARFIVLDTETDKGRVREAQFTWLQGQLEENKQTHVFVFLHRPLFPVDGHVGSSLDEFPEDRDHLHQLFVKHRPALKAVFQGHEHMYHLEERDGVPYHTVAGGGAPLYAPPELGGYFHYLLVKVGGEAVAIEVHKIGETPAAEKAAIALAPDTLLEGWESSIFWYTWDQSVRKALTTDHAAHGSHGLKVSFDLARYEWPVLMTLFYPRWDLRQVDRLLVDVFVPEGPDHLLSLTPSLKGKKSYSAPATALKPGWNTVSADLDGAWLPAIDRRSIEELQWALGAKDKKSVGWVVFDNLRAEAKTGKASQFTEPGVSQKGAKSKAVLPGLLESWERKLLWGAWNETVVPEASAEFVAEGKQGLKVSFNPAKLPRAVLYAALQEPWDLARPGALAVDIYVPKTKHDGFAAQLTLTAKGKKYRAPLVVIQSGWNKIVVKLDGWLPAEAARAVEQVEWSVSAPAQNRPAWVVFDNFRTGSQ